MGAPSEFYEAGFFDFTRVSNLDFCAQIPHYTCLRCGQGQITNFYNYPHLDVLEVISREERKRLGPVIHIKSSDDEIIRIIERLRQKWNIPVTAGTVFGPTCVKVTSKPKADFHVLVNHAGLFCRRPAVEKLVREGLAIEFVQTPANGKYGAEANYVEVVVPVIGHVQLPIEKSFCSTCLRYSPDGTFPTVLSWEDLPRNRPFFRTLEKSVIIFSAAFIGSVKRGGITGFLEGKTLLPVTVVDKLSRCPSLIKQETDAARTREARWRELLGKIQGRSENQAKKQSG